MRPILLACALCLTACERTEPPPLETAPSSSLWFICDAINAPALVVLERNGGVVRISEYEKPSGAIADRGEYAAASVEGAAGSAYTTLRRAGAEAGVVRELNPGMLETPGAAYTPPFVSVRLGERELSCRWLPRTRVAGFTGRRSFVVHEDADGDLIYTSYDFAAAAGARTIELSENGRATTFSTEVRDGRETITAGGGEYRFEAGNGYVYVVRLDRGEGALQVLHNGVLIQDEPLIAFQEGAAE